MSLNGSIELYGSHVRDPRALARRANMAARSMAGMPADHLTALERQHALAHGMTAAQVSQMRDRFETFLPKMASADPRSRVGTFLHGLLPPGATLSPGAGRSFAEVTARSRRTAASGSGPFGGSLGNQGGGVYQTAQQPYMPEWACLRKGTLVWMADGTRKPIEEIKVGDKVLDRLGSVQTVERAWSDGVPDTLVEIKLWGPQTLYSTDYHHWPTFAWVRTCLCGCGADVTPGRLFKQNHYRGGPPGVAAKHVYGADHPVTRHRIPDDYEPRQKVRADELRVKDFLLTPRRFDAIKTDVTAGQARLLGYYVAEGSEMDGPLGDYGVEFAFGAHEEATWVKDCVELCAQLGVETTLKHEPERGALYVRTVNDRGRNREAVSKLVAWLREHGGKGADTKRLSGDVLRWPLKLKYELLTGQIRGDGEDSWRESKAPGKEGRAFSVTYTTVSELLAAQMQLVFAQLGYPVRRAYRPAHEGRFPNGRVHDCKASYILVVVPPFAYELSRRLWPKTSKADDHVSRNVVSPKCMVDDDFVYTPIKSVKIVKNDEPVYNLTVSGDHSYLVGNGVATYNSPDRQSYPIHRILANIYWRLFFKLDPVIGTCIEMLAEMIWSNFTLSGDGVDGEIKDALEFMCEETRLRAMLPYMVKEFLVIGEVAPHLFFDDNEGIWTYLALHNPDQLEVLHAPFLKMDPLVEFRPEDRLRQVLMSQHPMLRTLRETMPPEIQSALLSGSNIPLSPINCTFIPRKLHPYDVRGTSLISRMWRILMFEDALFAASIAIARRAAAPLKVARLGDRNTGWIPGPEAETRMLELLTNSEVDPVAWLVTAYGVEFELVGAQERSWKIDASAEFIERVKLIALGMSKSFVVGEVTYASAASGLTVFLQRCKAMREFFEATWIYPKFFRPVSEMNGWVKPTQAELSHRVRTKRSRRELREANRYIIPKIEWERSLDPSVDSAVIQAAQALSGMGVVFSRTTLASLANRDFETELKQRIREVKIEQDLMAKHPELQQALAPAAGGEGGGGGGGGIAPAMPPESMGLEEGGGAPPPEGGPPPEAAAGDGSEGHGGTLGWSKDEAADLLSVLGGEAPQEEPWVRMLDDWRADAKDGDKSALLALRALANGDAMEAWEAVEEWLLIGGYPPRTVKALEHSLRKRGSLPKAATMDLSKYEELLDKPGKLGGDRFFAGAP